MNLCCESKPVLDKVNLLKATALPDGSSTLIRTMCPATPHKLFRTCDKELKWLTSPPYLQDLNLMAYAEASLIYEDLTS